MFYNNKSFTIIRDIQRAFRLGKLIKEAVTSGQREDYAKELGVIIGL